MTSQMDDVERKQWRNTRRGDSVERKNRRCQWTPFDIASREMFKTVDPEVGSVLVFID